MKYAIMFLMFVSACDTTLVVPAHTADSSVPVVSTEDGGISVDNVPFVGVDAGSPSVDMMSVDTGNKAEAAAAIDTEPSEFFNPCVEGYEQVKYIPVEDIYCLQTGSVYVANPCVDTVPSGWYGGGVIKCCRVPGKVYRDDL
jgi:hypothetical protein